MAEKEVRLWSVDLDCSPERLPALLECLSSDERARAERFRFDRDRRRFVAGRAALRRVLGDTVGIPASQIAFEYGPYGKPALASPSGAGVEFNVSHCEEQALIAVASGRRVGVDLELVSSETAEERMRIAERFFSAAEVAALRALPGRLQGEAFFACWTRKEAYIKARGEGLSMPLDAFSVSLAPGEPAALLDCPSAPEEIRAWSLRSLVPAPGFLAAVAVEGKGWRLLRQRF
ncbi:MAG: 4'-phosphopantetheinyl transferase superfamily protein [Thermoanaerobaculia bacterium]